MTKEEKAASILGRKSVEARKLRLGDKFNQSMKDLRAMQEKKKKTLSTG